MIDPKSLMVTAGPAFTVTLSAVKEGRGPLKDREKFAFTLNFHSVTCPEGPVRTVCGVADETALVAMMDKVQQGFIDLFDDVGDVEGLEVTLDEK